jgi:hypothetical protein
MVRFRKLIAASFASLAFAASVSFAATVPGDASFSYLFTIHDTAAGTTPVNTGQVIDPLPFVDRQSSYAAPGGNATIDLSSTAATNAGGLPITQAEVLGTSNTDGRADGGASAGLGYQIVLTGPGTPGDMIEVRLQSIGELIHESPCNFPGVCDTTTWLSSSALLRVSEGGTDHFLLGEFLDSTGSQTLFHSGIGSRSIDVDTLLMLPIETLININLGVSAFGATQGSFTSPSIIPPDDIRVFGMLDPSFTPVDSNFSVSVSSNLQPVPVPAAAWFFVSGLGMLAWVRRRPVN